MKVLTTDNAELRCEHAPRPGAPALLMLNSLGASLEMWDGQCAALGDHFELIRYDARGHGMMGSSVFVANPPHTPFGELQPVLQFLARALVQFDGAKSALEKSATA